jgi:hypothetical protein
VSVRLNLRNPGVAIALVLIAAVIVACAYFLGFAPHTPDVFTGQVYALRLPPLGVVYLTDDQHDLLSIGFWAAIAALAVAMGLSRVVAGRRR